jgi:hypothetical protein
VGEARSYRVRGWRCRIGDGITLRLLKQSGVLVTARVACFGAGHFGREIKREIECEPQRCIVAQYPFALTWEWSLPKPRAVLRAQVTRPDPRYSSPNFLVAHNAASNRISHHTLLPYAMYNTVKVKRRKIKHLRKNISPRARP